MAVIGPYVVVVEDNEGDRSLISRAFSRIRPFVHVVTLESAEELLKKFHDQEELPDLFMIDKNLPDIDGISLIDILNKDERYQGIPMILISGSIRSTEIKKAYKAGARSCIEKEGSVSDWNRKLRNLVTYWMKVNSPIEF